MNPTRSPHLLIVAAGYGLGIAGYAALPDGAPLARPMAAFLLPTAALVTYAMLRGLVARRPLQDTEPPDMLATYDAVMLRLLLFLLGVHATVLARLLQLLPEQPWAGRIVPLLLGLTMIGIGNLLPRTRPNLAIGIRTSRTLADRVWWAQTHRVAGYTLVAVGAVVAAAALTLPRPFGPDMIQLAAPVGLLILSVLLLRSKRRADGHRP